MRLRNLLFVLLLCMTVGMIGASCTGDDGAMGPPGPPGPAGPAGPAGEPGMMPGDPVTDEGCEVIVEGPRRYNGTSGDDIICGDDKRNRIFAMGGNDQVFAKGGNDVVHGGMGDDDISGGDGEDELRGNDGDDVINGGDDADDIEGGLGDDVMEGGAGNDVFWSNVSYSAPVEGDADATSNADGSDDFVGGDGVDTVDFSMSNDAVTINLAQGYTDFGMDHDDDSDTYESIENLVGTNNTTTGDMLTGDAGNNMITGGAGDDTISGGPGNDTIIPGPGQSAGEIDGGPGTDTYVVTEAGDTTINGTNVTGFENLLAAANPDGADAAINLTGDDMPNMLTGNGATNTLTGNGGNDVLNGGGGTDTLAGGPGDDVFVVKMGEGLDTISDFAFPNPGVAGTVDVICLVGFPAGSTVKGVTDNAAQLAVGDTPVLTLADAATVTTILRAASTFVKFNCPGM